MSHTDLIAIDKFAEELKLDFPLLLEPRSFSEELLNMVYEQVQDKINMALERAKHAFNEQAQVEAREH